MYLALRPLILKGSSAPEVEHLDDVGCTPDIGIYLKISSLVLYTYIFCGLLFSMLVEKYVEIFLVCHNLPKK